MAVGIGAAIGGGGGGETRPRMRVNSLGPSAAGIVGAPQEGAAGAADGMGGRAAFGMTGGKAAPPGPPSPGAGDDRSARGTWFMGRAASRGAGEDGYAPPGLSRWKSCVNSPPVTGASVGGDANSSRRLSASGAIGGITRSAGDGGVMAAPDTEKLGDGGDILDGDPNIAVKLPS